MKSKNFSRQKLPTMWQNFAILITILMVTATFSGISISMPLFIKREIFLKRPFYNLDLLQHGKYCKFQILMNILDFYNTKYSNN